MINIPKNHHQGERCFIIASGPSTKDMDLSHLRDEITICVNQSYKLLKGFDPTYICISDEGLWTHMRDVYPKMKTKVIASFADTEKFIKDYPGNNLAVMFENLDWERDPNVEKTYHFDITQGLKTSKNVVPSVAIPFAQWAGFAQVYLIGCDCTNNGYGYEGGAREKEQLFDDFTMQYYDLIAQKKCGTTIYNATIGGRLEAFPRIKLEEIPRPLMVIGYYTPNGDYKDHAKNMKKSVEDLGIRCEIEERPSVKDVEDPRARWALNANICPFFISDMRKKYPTHDLFSLDVDAVMLRRPEILLDHPRNYDFGAIFIPSKYNVEQLCGGGLYFAVSEKADELLKRWCQAQVWRNAEVREGIYKLPSVFAADQEVLQVLLPLIGDLRWIKFPMKYGYIEPTSNGKDVMPKVHDPIIYHKQASRTNNRRKD